MYQVQLWCKFPDKQLNDIAFNIQRQQQKQIDNRGIILVILIVIVVQLYFVRRNSLKHKMAGIRSLSKIVEEKSDSFSPRSSHNEQITYEEIMGMKSSGKGGDISEMVGGVEALSKRLVDFRRWCNEDAKIKIHPSICIVNGEATDGTKNAPVVEFGPPRAASLKPLTSTTKSGSGRTGMVDGIADRSLYERTLGCQIWSVREIKQDEVMMTCPKSGMITPDVVAASDAGRAILACCQHQGGNGSANFWDVFENTSICEERNSQKTIMNKGEQLLINTLRDRAKAEKAFVKATQNNESQVVKYELVPQGKLSTRAPFLAFLIHQRFSPSASPLVTMEANADFEKIRTEEEGSNALFHARKVELKSDTPLSFGPYARTLPSSVSLPICWERNELSMLSGCFPGVIPLQEIAATTMQLVAEFISLINAGILTRFPLIFPPGSITWERWVWAYSVFNSRIFPASSFLNDGEENAEAHKPLNAEDKLYSPPHVWDELGVLIPFLDMFNHESEAKSVLWQQNCSTENVEHLPRALVTKKIKKQQQIYSCYGLDNSTNTEMLLSYGFAQMLNPVDAAGIGWGLMDAIGRIQSPSDYIPLVENSEEDAKHLVYESSDTKAINDWWSDERLALLEREAFSGAGNSFMSSLKMGKQMKATAMSDGVYNPILLTATLVSSMPITDLEKLMAKDKLSDVEKCSIVISMRHQRVLRSYLLFLFSRKLEKLLENINKGLKNHYGSLKLWTKASEGGIRYLSGNAQNDDAYTGWRTFFDQNAYAATMEVEKQYYALAPESCFLTLIDGHLQSLQSSIDNLLTWKKFQSSILKQLDDLGFHLVSSDDGSPLSERQFSESAKKKDNEGNEQHSSNQNAKKDDNKTTQKKKNKNKKKNSSSNTPVPANDRPAAIKLHIGNLSYLTTPSDLFDFFSSDFGRDNILECHIPAERATGKSRGFGFVTLPESIARRILNSDKSCEINGRILKVAESNSMGTNKPNRHPEAPAPVSNDRCADCGYRPKYCVCQAGPSVPRSHVANHSVGSIERDRGYYGRDKYQRGGYSRSPSPYSRRRSERDDHYRDHSRDRDRRHYDYDRDYSRSRSRSLSRDRERRREGRRDRKIRSSRDRSHEKHKDRSRDRSRDRERYRERSRERSKDRSRDRGRYRGRSRDRSRDRKDRHSIDQRSSLRHSQSPDDEIKINANQRRKSNNSRSPESESNNGSVERHHESRKRRSRSRDKNRKSRRRKRRARSRSLSDGSVSST